MYKEGRGVKKSNVDAVRWWTRAALAGHAPAQANLGLMYWSALHGGLINTAGTKIMSRSVEHPNLQRYFVFRKRGRTYV